MVNGLKATAGINVVRPESDYFILSVSDLQQRVLSHDLSAYDKPLTLVRSELLYVSEDVTVQGEQRCLQGVGNGEVVSVEQGNIHVNLKLTRGWNALVRLVTPAEEQGPPGGAFVADVVWMTVPHEVIERWK